MSIISLEVEAERERARDPRFRERTPSLTFKFYEGEKERRETTQKIHAVRSVDRGRAGDDEMSFDTFDRSAQVRAGSR